MEQSVSLITLGSADRERSAAFYGALGWKAVYQNDHLAVFDPIGQSPGLYDRERLARDMGVAPERLETGAASLAHTVRETAEVAQVIAQAQDAGAEILRPAHEAFWGGVVGSFADPDSHVWEVAWNPGSPLSPDGAFRWGGHDGARDGGA